MIKGITKKLLGKFYLEACKNSDYNSLSKSSLWRILVSIKPSKRNHLGGFNNLTASGINGFETLLKLASKYRIEKTTTKTIQNGKRYLKTNYQMHCNTISYSQSKTHSFIFFIWCNKTCLRVKLPITAQMILENWLKQYKKFNQL